MSPEVITALITIISGGALSTIINLLLENSRQRRTAKEKGIDERIAAWRKISEKNEERIAQLERKLEANSADMESLEQYVLMLQQIILKTDPSLALPERPKLHET